MGGIPFLKSTEIINLMKTISRPAEGYPIDSYYLMDFSYSMKDDLENLKLLAGNLTEEFRRVSEDFTIGISSRIDFLFIDKLLIRVLHMSQCIGT